MKGADDGGPSSFHLPHLEGREEGEIVLLDEDESRHVRTVRLAEGAPIVLTDGRGNLREARLGALRGRRREAVLGGPLPAPATLPVDLAVAVGNRNRMLWLVEKASELGVESVSLVETERSRSVSDAGRSPSFRDKAARRALAALKQSGGARLPSIRPVRELADFVESFRSEGTGSGLVLDRAGRPLASLLGGAVEHLTLLVGPEGGLSERELDDCAAAGFLRARLCPSILRFETAALAALAVVAQQQEMSATDRG